MRPTAMTTLCLTIVAGLTVIAIQSVGARTHPGRIGLSAGPQPVSSASGDFNCGTYRSNGYRDHWYDSRSQAERPTGGAGTSAVPPSFINDDVWVVTDDGTLTISGTNLFDTPGAVFRFTPNGGGYDISTATPHFDIGFGENLNLGDDGEAVRSLGFSFSFYGVTWTEIHVSSNGGIALGAPLNPSGFFDPDDFFSPTPKLAPYYMDLDPTSGVGSPAVYFKSSADSAVITWAAINEFGSSRKNTFQVTLRPDGSFDFEMIGIQSIAAITSAPIVLGIHPGGAPSLDRISMSDDLPYSGTAGVGVYEDYLSLSIPAINETALAQAFYLSFPDDFFQYVFFTNFTQTMAGFANESNLSNDVTGIGLPIFDNSALYGSSGVLESRCNMSNLAVWTQADPAARFRGTQSFLTIMGQEAGHRWGAFVYFRDGADQPSNMMLGRSDAHWSYYADVDHSCLEGGNWVEASVGAYTCPDNVDKFSEIDEYLFGVRTPEEVSDMFYVSSASNDLPSNRDNPPPPAGANAFGVAVGVTIQNFIAQEGLRTPVPADENKDLRQAFIFVLANGTAATPAQLDKLSTFRRAWEDYFETSCDGRLTLNTSITQVYAPAVVEGHVVDRTTTDPIDEIVVFSRERSFRQHVPGGGRYTFRYLENESSGSAETVTLVAQAPGYLPDSVTTSIDYGTQVVLDIELDKDPLVSVAITRFDVRPLAGGIELLARFASTYDTEVRVNIYRDSGQRWENIATLTHAGSGDFRFVDTTAFPGTHYRYRIGVVDADGEFLSQERHAHAVRVMAALAQNVPNPFNPSTTIPFVLSEELRVRLTVFDASGRQVRTLVDEVRGHGTHQVEWDGTDDGGNQVGSGVYFYRLVAGSFRATQKMVLVK